MSTTRLISCAATAAISAAMIAGRIAAPRAQTPSAPAAQMLSLPPGDVRLLGQLITLDAPASDVAAQNALALVLTQQGIRLGLEGPAVPADEPAFDFAHPPDRRLTLTGLTLAQALDKVTEADPHFHWTTREGAIVGRFAASGTVLDRRIDRFVVADASPRAALTALVAALDPARSGQGIIGMGRAAAGRADQPPARLGRNVSLALEHPTVGDVLAALMREDPALSWHVTYLQTPASYENAQFDLMEGDDLVTAMPASALHAPPSAALAPTFRVGGSDLSTMLQAYARHAYDIKLGFEALPSPMSRVLAFAPSLDLSGIPPEQAIRRITAYDSRYETVRVDDRFITRPKPEARSAQPFEAKLAAFTRTDESFNIVLSDLLTRLGATAMNDFATPPPMAGPPPPPAPGTSPATGALNRLNEARLAADDIRRHPISVSWPAGQDVSEAISALADAINAPAWILRGTMSSSGSIGYQLTFDTELGLSFGKSFQIRGAVVVPPASTAPTPPRPEMLVQLALSQAERTLKTLITYELAEAPSITVTGPVSSAAYDFRNLQAQEAVSRTAELCGACVAREDHGVFRIVSKGLPASGLPLDRPMAAVTRHFASANEVLDLVRQAFGMPVAPAGVGFVGSQPTARTLAFDVTFPGGTLRDFLDAAAKAHGSMTWGVVYTDANGTYPMMTLNLIGFDGWGIGAGIQIR